MPIPNGRRDLLDLRDLLKHWDAEAWEDACGKMRICILRGNFPIARAVLNEFVRGLPKVLSQNWDVTTSVMEAFPLRIANMLSLAGYQTLGAVRAARDEDLLRIQGLGTLGLSQIHEAIRRLGSEEQAERRYAELEEMNRMLAYCQSRLSVDLKIAKLRDQIAFLERLKEDIPETLTKEK